MLSESIQLVLRDRFGSTMYVTVHSIGISIHDHCEDSLNNMRPSLQIVHILQVVAVLVGHLSVRQSSERSDSGGKEYNAKMI
jgi:hypothetical protein